MRRGVLAFLLALPAPAAALYGGRPADGREFAAVVLIYEGDERGDPVGSRTCTGTLISPRWVLTAGHCVNDIRRYYFVGVRGAEGEPSWKGRAHWPVSAVRFLTERWVRTAPPLINEVFDWDVGLLFLAEPVPARLLTVFPRVSSPAEADRDAGPPSLEGLVTMGYGLGNKCGSGAPWIGGGDGVRRWGVSRVEPVKSFGGERLATVLREASDSPACMRDGDSGGPLMHWSSQRVLGVVSRPDNEMTPPQRLAFQPAGRGLYSRVTPYWCDFFHEVARRSSGSGAELKGAVPWCNFPD